MGELSRRLGVRAEDDALAYLLKDGRLRLLSRNFRCRVGEIDLVMEQKLADGTYELVFVEVRARAAESWSSALESVDRTKRIKLVRAIKVYLNRYKGSARSLRVDIVARDGSRWFHIRNARIVN